jgi:queuine tRNA-ribosyltransferase
VAHTVDWASRCKEEFERRANSDHTPKLFAAVQGGTDEGLRRECAERLLQIGFDGYGYGGWPIADDGGLVEAVAQVAELVPVDAPKHALGIGKPENVVRAFELGYHTFDCTIPTRDARNKRLCVFDDEMDYLSDDFYHYVYIGDEQYARDGRPIDATCDGLCCQRYSRAYIHHLFAIGETLALRLATIHNLRFYGRLMEKLSATFSSRV